MKLLLCLFVLCSTSFADQPSIFTKFSPDRKFGEWQYDVNVESGSGKGTTNTSTKCITEKNRDAALATAKDLANEMKDCNTKVVTDTASLAVSKQVCRISGREITTTMTLTRIDSGHYKFRSDSDNNGSHTIFATDAHYLKPCSSTTPSSSPKCSKCKSDIEELKKQCAQSAPGTPNPCASIVPKIEAACLRSCE